MHGVDVRGPTGGAESSDVLVSKLNGDSSYGWTYSAGGPGYAAGEALAVEPGGGVLVAGYFQNTVDFDPGDATNRHTCPHFFCEFLLRLHANGTLDWVRTTPSTMQDPWRHLSLNEQGDLYMTRLLGTADADPTCGVDQVFAFPPHFGPEQYVTKMSCAGTPGDFDGNSFVDLFDLSAYQNCFTGNPGEENCATAQGLCEPCANGCDVFDVTPDNALDLTDFAALQNLLTGP